MMAALVFLFIVFTPTVVWVCDRLFGDAAAPPDCLHIAEMVDGMTQLNFGQVSLHLPLPALVEPDPWPFVYPLLPYAAGVQAHAPSPLLPPPR